MKEHSQVTTLEAQGGGVYELTNIFGKKLRIFVCECYSFGAAEYTETKDKLGRLDAIIVNSAWCGYTSQAKRLARGEKVGLFKIGDFMSALNKADFSQYLNDKEHESFQKNGWL